MTYLLYLPIHCGYVLIPLPGGQMYWFALCLHVPWWWPDGWRVVFGAFV